MILVFTIILILFMRISLIICMQTENDIPPKSFQNNFIATTLILSSI